MKKMLWRKSIRSQLIISFILPFILFSVVAFGFVYYVSSYIIQDHVIPQFDERLTENGETLAEKLDPTLIQNVIAFPEKYGEELKQELDSFIKNKNGIEYVYVLARHNGRDVIVALNDSDEFMVESPFTEEQKQSYEQKEQILSSIYQDKWGVHKSFFMPVRGTDAIIGVDMSAKFIKQLEHWIWTFSIILTAVMIAAGIILALFIGNRIDKPLKQLVQYTKRLSNGDLSQPIKMKREDEIGILAASFEEMRKNLSHIIQQVSDNSQTIHGSSEILLGSFAELSQASQQIAVSTNEEAKGSEERAHHIDRISHMISEMSMSISNVDEQTKWIKNLTGQAREQAEKGNIQVQMITEQMSKIKQNGITSKQNLSDLGEKLKQINHIIQMIQEISSQIHLLALNASIEAARAGDAGRGFSVVAQEVQKLAHQTDESIQVISQAIEEMNEQAKVVLQLNQQDFEDIVKGVEIAEDNGRLFHAIYESVEQLTKGMDAIAKNTEDLYQSSDQVLTSIQEIAAISEQGVAVIQEISASAIQQNHTIDYLKEQNIQLKRLADHLQEMIAKFKIE
ncbi:methyl-accepting chemotaxis protein [Anoxybacillus sp. UARK-01]|uniref:Methyl-accepting chemotaxis protein n=1 Tax=Anoxybacteroides rupiense TaxID=311460 RepID=A0ABD5IZA8_9BACL|nr:MULTISPECIES: methyl-accepting chemotaxis protein [Anoxybacillus]MED5053707.1 methyl-accepting chemotaxis protein [Anoxybacillus rupiensis]OQM44577.1 methyl-accepting chemotaxis protein [Anoxybacillus sp. UARK-01]